MEAQSLHRQLALYTQYKLTLISQLNHCKRWFSEHHSAQAECQLGLDRALKQLTEASFTVACSGDFAHGRTALINVLLMTGCHVQPLPDATAQTNTCPVEIFYNPDSAPNTLRLLPIESRRTGVSLKQLKNTPDAWMPLDFDLNHAATAQQIIGQLSRTKSVTAEVARTLGFNPNQLPSCKESPDLFTISAWRLGQLNIELPLLKLGLKVLDIPGLSAFDFEPELAYNNLHNADAILFTLDAGQPVNNNDRLIWKKHLQQQKAPITTLLTNAETLHDLSQLNNEYDQKLTALKDNIAQHFKQPPEKILALSTQMAQQAHISGDPLIRFKSKLPELEILLSQQLINSQQTLFKHHLIDDAIAIMRSSHQQLKKLMYSTETELKHMQHVGEKPQLLQRSIETLLRDKHQLYHRAKRRELDLRAQQARLEMVYRSMKQPLSASNLTPLLQHAQHEMRACLTVHSLKQVTAHTFNQLQQLLDSVDSHASHANALLAKSYREARASGQEYGTFQRAFDISPQRIQLLQLQSRTRLLLAPYKAQQSTKHPIIRRLIQALLQTIHVGAQDFQLAIDDWLVESMAPIKHHTHYQKTLTERLVTQLTNINQKQLQQQNPIVPFRALIAHQESALFELERLIAQLNGSPAIRTRLSPSVKSSSLAQPV